MVPPMKRGRLAYGLAVLALLGVCLATLTPRAGREPEPGAQPPLRAERRTADTLANLALFAPLGFALTLAGWPVLRIGLVSAGLASGIELLQRSLPGRTAGVGDALANAAGALLGAAAWAALAWGVRRAGARAAGGVALAGAGLAAGLGLLPALLVVPSLPESVYTGFWAADTGGLNSSVRELRLGGRALAPGRLASGAELRRLLRSGAPLELVGTSGSVPPDEFDVMLVIRDEQREILFLGGWRDDLVFRLRTRASALGLQPVAWRAPGLLAAPRGEPFRLSVERDRSALCVRRNDDFACPLGFGVGDGWKLIQADADLPAPLRDGLDLAWLAALAFPVGWFARRGLPSGLALALLLGALGIAPVWLGMLPTPPLHAAAAGIGLLAGLSGRAGLSRGSRAPRW